MIRTHVRVRGASAIGAAGPGQTGPFGTWPEPAEDDHQMRNAMTDFATEPGPVEGDLDDGQDDEHRVSVRRTDGSAADRVSAANTTEGATP